MSVEKTKTSENSGTPTPSDDVMDGYYREKNNSLPDTVTPKEKPKLDKPAWTYWLGPLLTFIGASLVFGGALIANNLKDKEVSANKAQFEIKREDDEAHFKKGQEATRSQFDIAQKNSLDIFGKQQKAGREQFGEQQKFGREQQDKQQRLERAKFTEQQELDREQFATQQTAAEARAKEARTQFERAQTTQSKQFETTLATNDLRFKIEQVEKQFKDVQDRLANSDAKTRAVASLQLAELAQQPLPGKPSKPFTEKSYPFFSRVTLQFASILPVELDDNVRKATVKALRRMVSFAKERNEKNSEKERLLTEMANEIAQGNRDAKDTFIRAMAEYSVTAQATEADEIEEMDWTFVASLAPFCEEAKTTKMCLNALKMEGESIDERGAPTKSKYAVQRQVFAAKREALEAEARTKENALRLPALETAAKQLMDTRNALATALKALAKPAKLPDLFVRGTGWRRPLSLNLSGVFLAGADLRVAQLQEANLVRAQLQGADLRETQLQGAELNLAQLQGADLLEAQLQGVNLREAQLQRVNLLGAQLQGADLDYAQLQGADLLGAQLQGADLNYAQLQGVNLREAQLQGADLNYAQLQGVNLREAQLQGAYLFRAQLQGADLCEAQLYQTYLYGVIVQREDTKVYRQTHFEGSCYSRAVFTPPQPVFQSGEADKQMAALQEWLKQFPEMLEKKVVTYEAWEKIIEKKY